MEYRIVRTGENKDYLEHAIHGMGKRTYSGTSQKSNSSGGGSDSGGTGQGRGRQKGFQLDNHLYLARQWVGDKWRYAYNQAEVKAMQNWGKAKKAAGDVADAAKGAAGTAKKILSGDYAKGVDRKVDAYQTRVNANRASRDNALRAEANAETNRNYARAGMIATDPSMASSKKVREAMNKSYKAYEAQRDTEQQKLDNARAVKEASARAGSVAEKGLKRAKDEQSSAAYKISKASGAVRDYVNDTTDKAKKAIENERTSPTSTTNRARNAVSNIGYEAARGVKNAGKAVSDYASDKANKAKNVYEKAKSDVGDYVSDKASKASKMAKEAGDILSGKKAKDIDSKASHYRESANAAEERRNEQGQNKDYDAAYRTEKIRKNLDERATKYEDQQKGAGYRISKAVNDARDAARDIGSKASKAASDASDLMNKTLSSVNDRVSEGKRKALAILDKASENGRSLKDTTMKAAQDAADRGKKRLDKFLEDSADFASRTYGKAKTQVELAKNAASEAEYDRYHRNRIKNAEKEVSSIEKEIAKYNKMSQEDKDFNAGWYRAKQRELEAAKDELNKAKEAQRDWEDNDKTTWRMTDRVSSMNPNMRELDPVTSSERKADIKEQNLYKYDKSYREASDRASYLGSYLDNWDKNGGPKTAEGKANYQRMLRELNALEAQLDAKRK